MNRTVYVVTWYDHRCSDWSPDSNGILGVFSSKYFADEAVKKDKALYPWVEYELEFYTLDEVK
jgi:hypothetical protein